MTDEQGRSEKRTEENGMIIESNARYQLEQILGRGGMGAVWKARAIFPAGPGTEDDVEREVAIKVVSNPFPELTRRLVKEARLIARLNHENIVRFEGWDIIPETGAHFIVMEYIKGIDAEKLIEMHGLDRIPARTNGIMRIPDKIVGFLLFSVGNALSYAHTYRFDEYRTGVLHRDISPGNMLIKLDEGCVKLSDFGIAVTPEELKGDEGKSISGKIPYLSPEAAFSPDRVDARSDIYSLGVAAYELVTGLKPNDSFEDATNERMLMQLYQATTKTLVPPHEIVCGVDRRLSEIICKMLATKPEERYQTAAELVDEVGRKYLYDGKYGPTKAGLREYIIALQNPANVGSDAQNTLRFLKDGRFGGLQVFRPYELNKRAKAMIEKGINPSRP